MSSAVKGEPSWNLTLRRSSNRTWVGETKVHYVARAGSTSYFALYRTKPS
jgi:hypothetical protein